MSKNFKSGLLAVLLYLNVITLDEYIGERLHKWEVKSVYRGQPEVDSSSDDKAIDKAEGDREPGSEDNT